MFRKFRQAHLWIGLISSILLFIEAGTGLLLTEPWLLGQPSGERFEFRDQVPLDQMRSQTGIQEGTQNGAQNPSGTIHNNSSSRSERFRYPDGTMGGRFGNSLLAIVRGIHSGRIGNVDIRWLIDLSAVSILFLTATGIYLSIKTLRARRKVFSNKEVSGS
ncbi:PepSY-associated TM helix domain-containing protein [Thermicanus aegyptius]|uniref:PepSY-associated TM helix domain-containing protein n=1 Tax=Thermicanus aegyptius TaxID=94009 RepID=UPI000491DB4D|nr:PepSY-associated TM helix domain-containing protein [Thermicanus aegyptius]